MVNAWVPMSQPFGHDPDRDSGVLMSRVPWVCLMSWSRRRGIPARLAIDLEIDLASWVGNRCHPVGAESRTPRSVRLPPALRAWEAGSRGNRPWVCVGQPRGRH